MAQKVIQIGSSIGVTIPKDVAEQMEIRVGDPIEMKVNADEGLLTVIHSTKKQKSAVDPEILSWTDKFIEKNRELLERLADK